MKILVIGTGYWGKNHVRVFNELKHEEVIDSLTICDADEKRVKKLADVFDIQYAVSYRQFVNSDIDAVSIVTPSSTHFQIAKEFMEVGKDVFVEKPMTLDSIEAKKLVNLAEENDTILAVGHIFRYHSAVQELKKRVDRGDFGKIYHMYSDRLTFGKPREDMGVLFALAIHEVDLFCYFLNEKYPEEISATIGKYTQPNVDEIAMVTLSFADNIKAYAIESWLTPVYGKKRDFVLIGSNMSAKIDYLKPQELQIFDASIVDHDGALTAENEGSYTIPIKYSEPLKDELKHFVECVKSRETPLADMYAGKRAVKMIEMALKSAKEGKAIKCQT